jgi:peptide/nickel transport system substrate-binding protein
MNVFGILLSVSALLVACFGSGPAAAENVLRFTGGSGGALTFDPHSLVDGFNLTATHQVYEVLLDVDSDLELRPQLALAWNLLNPAVWEFELRRDVRFHDGMPFTARDVVFSLDRARASTSDLKETVRTITNVEAIDDDTVHITTAGPDPLLWLKLSRVAIMSKAWAEQHGVAVPADFGAREETYSLRHSNGTGPFMLESFEPGGDYILVRNPEWWGEADYPHNIDRIVHTWTGDPERDLEALLNGEIHLLQDPPFAAHDRIRRTPGVKVETAKKLLTQFFGFDQSSAQLRSSSVKGANPFKDLRVRQAVYHAVDVQAILGDLMGDLLIPAGMLIAPGVNGYSPELDRRLPYNPEKAKALLVEAGYPDGFNVTLDCPNEWGDDEITMCWGAAAQLGKIGINVVNNFRSTDEHYAKIFARRQSDFYLDAWDADADSAPLLKKLFHSHGSWNGAGYANPRIDELIEKIDTEMITYGRDVLLEETWRIVTDDVVYLPIRHAVTVWAMREVLEIPVDPWNVPRFRRARLRETN